ncbi:hypothetical protein MTO96_034399, partial [Rhipicephalus appendiculatus]
IGPCAPSPGPTTSSGFSEGKTRVEVFRVWLYYNSQLQYAETPNNTHGLGAPSPKPASSSGPSEGKTHVEVSRV